MAKKISLREFQEHLAARLVGASGQSAAGLLGIQSGADYWLVNLSDSGEIVPLTPLTAVPLTKPWFAGIANIRGNLYSVADFSAFQGKDPTPQNAGSRLLLVGTRHGTNAAHARPAQHRGAHPGAGRSRCAGLGPRVLHRQRRTALEDAQRPRTARRRRLHGDRRLSPSPSVPPLNNINCTAV